MTRKDRVYKDIINKMFEIAEHDLDFEKAKKIPEFYLKYSITKPQEEEWMQWGIKHIKFKLGYNNHLANLMMNMINLNHGLTLSDGNT